MKYIIKWYKEYRNYSIGTKILVWMVIGIVAGVIFGADAVIVQPLGDIFIRLLMMAAIPLVFFNLMNGLAGLRDVKSLGRITGKIAFYYAVTTLLAFSLALFAVNKLKPGLGFQLSAAPPEELGEMPKLVDLLVNMVPDNVFRSFAEGNMVQIVIFAVLLGLTVLLLPQKQKEPLTRALDLLSKLFRDLVNFVLKIGPLGIAALMASAVGEYGSKMLGPLALFLGGIWGVQIVMMIVFIILLFVFTRMSPLAFFRKTGALYSTAIATCSSWASLAVAMQVSEDNLKLPKSIYSFTLPLGIQMNKNGTAVMLVFVLLFTAQAVGIEFDFASQVTIILVGLLLETGSGGIPGGGLVIALIFVKAFNLPLEIAAIVGGIYRLVDMGNTTTNMMSDLVGTTIVAHSEMKRNNKMEKLEKTP